MSSQTTSGEIGHNFSLVYPTLIGKFQMPDADSVNAQLLELVLERERNDTTRDYANVGGWHSAGDLLEWPNPAIAQLRTWISEALKRTVQASSQLPEVRERNPPKGNFRVSAWANVSRKGNYHRMHNHPGSAWSGVYYVAAQPSNDSLGGVLEFYDPRPFTEMNDTPFSPYGQRMIVRPVAGMMVLFPGWLYHSVHPNTADEARLSIAFNASWISA